MENGSNLIQGYYYVHKKLLHSFFLCPFKKRQSEGYVENANSLYKATQQQIISVLYRGFN